MRRRRRVARSATSCFVFRSTLCQTGSSCLRTMASNEQKYTFLTFRSSRSSYNQAGVSNLNQTDNCRRTVAFHLLSSASVVNTLHDGPMNILHRKRLIQLNDVCLPSQVLVMAIFKGSTWTFSHWQLSLMAADSRLPAVSCTLFLPILRLTDNSGRYPNCSKPRRLGS